MQKDRLTILALFLFLILAALISFRTLNSFFISDDFCHIENVMGKGIFGTAVTPGQFFRPLTSALFYLDYRLWGLEPAGYHLTNILLHGFNSFLLFLIFSLVLGRYCPKVGDSRLAALLAGLVFLLNPSHSESLFWISGRTDLLAALFSFSSFLCYLHFNRNRRQTGLLVASVLFYALACFSKESAFVLPPLIIFLEISEAIKDRSLTRQSLAVSALFLTAAVGYLLTRQLFLPDQRFLRSDLFRLPERTGNLLLRAFLPPLPEAPGIPWTSLLAGAVIFSLSFLAAREFLRKKTGFSQSCGETFYLILSCLFFFIILAGPALLTGKGASPFFIFRTFDERFLYLPSAPAALILVLLIKKLLPKNSFRPFMATVLIFYALSLDAGQKKWAAAADLSKKISRKLVDLPPARKLILINLPDNLDGPYVLRNGLQEFLKIYGKISQFKKVTFIARQSLSTDLDEIIVNRQGLDFMVRAKSRTFPARSSGHEGPWNISGDSPNNCIIEKEVLYFTLPELTEEDILVYFSGGRLIRAIK